MDVADMVYTASVGTNAPVFADILRLYVPRGADGCDVTYGKGCFWTKDSRAWVGELRASDLLAGVCLSSLPYAEGSQGWHVLDPPYMSGFFRPQAKQKAQATNSDFSSRYGNHGGTGYKGRFNHEAVSAIYRDGISEAYRVLIPGGIQVTKVQDEVSSHRQWLTHVEVINHAESLGFRVVDLFVVVRRDRPHGQRISKQEHARKNHSFFVVFRKPKREKRANS